MGNELSRAEPSGDFEEQGDGKLTPFRPRFRIRTAYPRTCDLESVGTDMDHFPADNGYGLEHEVLA